MRHLVFKILILLTAVASQAQTTFTSTVGVDAWDTQDSPARYLPDYGVKPSDWRSVNPWAQAKLRHETQIQGLRVTTTAQGNFDPMKGGKLNRLDVDVYSQAHGMGARAGVLPYRMTWCRTYDQGTTWIAEPDVFCRFSGLNEMNQSAAGLQAYATADVKGWAVDGMVGTYRPSIYGDDDKLGPFFAVGPNAAHKKRGLAINALHLATGTQFRAGYLRTAQDQDTTPQSWQRQLRYDSHYLAAETAIAPGMAVRASLSAYVGDQVNNAKGGGFHFNGQSTTLEMTYTPGSGHTFAAGLSRYVNTTTYQARAGVQRLAVPSITAAYRRDLQDGWYCIVQALRTADKFDPIAGTASPAHRQGSAIGARLARVF